MALPSPTSLLVPSQNPLCLLPNEVSHPILIGLYLSASLLIVYFILRLLRVKLYQDGGVFSGRPTRRGNLPIVAFLCLLFLIATGLFLNFYQLIFMSFQVLTHPLSKSLHQLDLYDNFENAAARSQFEANIPPVIHQIMFDFGRNKSIPVRWSESPKSWKKRNPAYEHIMWNEQMVLELIKQDYPWFLPTYLSYNRKIQQVDAAKYLILHAKGGIYADMDIICEAPMDQLLKYDLIVATTAFGLANDFMMSAPKHHFLLYAIKSLHRFHTSYFSPFLEVMYSTGPIFFSYVFVESGTACGAEKGLKSLHPLQYGSATKWAITKHITGMTWHNKDATFIWVLWEQRIPLAALGVLAATLAVFLWRRGRRKLKNE